jgi:hypothetical protein
MDPAMCAGLPTTIAPSGTERVTTAPVPTMARSPFVMPGSITAPLPDRCPGHNDGSRELLGILFAARKLVVGKRDVGANKHIITHTQTVAQLHAASDRNAVADDDVVLNQAVRAYVAVLANPGAGQDGDKLPDASARADGG